MYGGGLTEKGGQQAVSHPSQTKASKDRIVLKWQQAAVISTSMYRSLQTLYVIDWDWESGTLTEAGRAEIYTYADSNNGCDTATVHHNAIHCTRLCCEQNMMSKLWGGRHEKQRIYGCNDVVSRDNEVYPPGNLNTSSGRCFLQVEYGWRGTSDQLSNNLTDTK
jgi:hypothetical protein